MEKPEKLNPFKKAVSLLTLTAAIFASSGIGRVHLAQAGQGKGERRGKMAEKMQELGLSEEQKKKVKEIRQSGREQGKKLREENKTARNQLKEAMQKDASKEELTRLFQNVQQKKQAMATHRFNQALEIRAVLTPEQRKKAGEMMEKFIEKRKKGDKHLDDDSDDE